MNESIKAGSDIHAGDGGYSLGTQEKYDEFVKGRNQSLGKMRIKQLAEQAGYSKDYLEIGLPSNMEKFAELIVKECVQVARVGIEFGPSMEEAVYTYFGVEE